MLPPKAIHNARLLNLSLSRGFVLLFVLTATAWAVDPNRQITQYAHNGGRSGHWGLPGIHERAKQIGAELTVWSELGAGTEVELSIPGSIAYEASPTRPRFRLFRKRTEQDHEHQS